LSQPGPVVRRRDRITMIFSWLKRRRRRRLLATPFPTDWLVYLQSNVALYGLLSEAEQAKLRDDLRVLIAEKTWEGCGGLTATEAKTTETAGTWCCTSSLINSISSTGGSTAPRRSRAVPSTRSGTTS